jgi:hypothetical protein
MGLYQLCYTVGGAFEGVLFLEAGSHGAALWQADREGIAPGDECDVIELHPDDARAIPEEFIGRLLNEDDATELERTLIAGMRKKPAAPSVRRTATSRAYASKESAPPVR